MSAKNNKFKLFVENMLIYGLGSVISKLIPLLMTFVLTYFLSTEKFGVNDNYSMIQQLGVVFAVLGMYDAMYRLFFERDDEKYKKEICSTAMAFNAVATVIVVALMILLKNPLSDFAFDSLKYSFLIDIAAVHTLVSATNNIISAPTRMQNKRKVFLVTNTLSPIISYSISIPLILKGHTLIALPVAGILAGLTMEIAFAIMNRHWFSPKYVKKAYIKPMLRIALPLVPNFMIYWVFKFCDKTMIVHMLDLSANGLYGAGGKLGHCSQIIYQAFSNGYQFFVFSTMKEKNQVKDVSLIFEYLGAVSLVSTAYVCAVARPVFLFMQESYHSAYVVSTYLFLAPLLLMLFQVACNQLIVVKNTWPNIFMLTTGAVVNLVLNWVLIPVIGIEGAAIATLSGYVVSVVIICIVLIKMKLMVIPPRFYIMTALFVAYFLGWRFFLTDKSLIAAVLAVLFLVVVTYLYRKDLNVIVDKINAMLAKRKKKAENV